MKAEVKGVCAYTHLSLLLMMLIMASGRKCSLLTPMGNGRDIMYICKD
jgi:hypothetical protein